MSGVSSVTSSSHAFLLSKQPDGLNDRKVTPVSSSRGYAACTGYSLSVISLIAITLFVLGIVYWVRGTSLGNPAMVRMGKILFGVSFILKALLIIAGCVICYAGVRYARSHLISWKSCT